MLIKDFYTIENIEKVDDDNHIVSISLNKDHDIFKGHFPDNPILPGVCTLQILKEIAEKLQGKKLSMKSARSIKFTAKVNPYTHPNLNMHIHLSWTEEQTLQVKSKCYFEDTLAVDLNILYSTL